MTKQASDEIVKLECARGCSLQTGRTLQEAPQQGHASLRGLANAPKGPQTG